MSRRRRDAGYSSGFPSRAEGLLRRRFGAVEDEPSWLDPLRGLDLDLAAAVPKGIVVDPADPLGSIVRGQIERTCRRWKITHPGTAEAVLRRVMARQEVPSLLAAIAEARPWVEASGRAADAWGLALWLDVMTWCAEELVGVQADRERRAVAMPSTTVAHWVDRALGGRVSKQQRTPESVRLVIPGYKPAQLQLELPWDPDDPARKGGWDGLLGALWPKLANSRQVAAKRGREGELWAHYFGLHVLWSSNGHRAAVWRLTEHMRRIGHTEAEIRDTRARKRASAVMDALLAAKIVMQHPDGSEDYIRLAIDLAGRREQNGTLDGAIIRPGLLYEGVRGADGVLGSEHVFLLPSAAALPPRLSLALKLSSDRAQYSVRGSSGRPAAVWSRQTLQAALGVIRLRDLDKTLAELQALPPEEHGTWHEDGDNVVWNPPAWSADRLLGVTPIEPLGVLVEGLPTTGAELEDWRKARNLTQADLAALVGRGERTVRQWEALGVGPLPSRARVALQDAADPAHRPSAERTARSQRKTQAKRKAKRPAKRTR